MNSCAFCAWFLPSRFLGEPMTDEEITSIIEEADRDKDGTIGKGRRAFCNINVNFVAE